ncbi:hypothetical protein M422DRAFT_239352 [Sphaerobolus stellatus SS14]|nr:hypothetical protein M422DRAFT_239352 [Sphaerobolus stellatus SS14]
MFDVDSDDHNVHSEFVPSPSELKSIHKELQDIEQKYKRYISLAAPIRRVPDEILQMIQLLSLELFPTEWLVRIEAQNVQSIYETRGRLARVCQRWNRTLRATSAWTIIGMAPTWSLTSLRTSLEYSRSLPLDLYIFQDVPPQHIVKMQYQIAEATDILIPHMRRLRYIRIQGEDNLGWFRSLFHEDKNVVCPLLRTIDLSDAYSYEDLSLPKINAPNLTRLYLTEQMFYKNLFTTNMTCLVEAAFPILDMTHLMDLSLLAPNICTLSLGIFMKTSTAMLSAQFKRLHTLIVAALYKDMLYNALQQLHIPAVQHVTLLSLWSGDSQENSQVSWPNLETLRLNCMRTTNESSEYVRRFFLNVPTLRILHLTRCDIPQFYSTFLSSNLEEPVLCPQLHMLVLQSCAEPKTEGLKEFIQDRMILRNSQGTEVPLRVGLDQESYSSILWLGSPIFKEPYTKEITTEWISPFPERETRFVNFR